MVRFDCWFSNGDGVVDVVVLGVVGLDFECGLIVVFGYNLVCFFLN